MKHPSAVTPKVGNFGWALLCFLLATGLLAQPKKLHLEHLTYEQGLSQSLVTSILQDRFGYLWFGTQEGLNRFDGYHFTVYKHEPSREDSLANDWVLSIYEDLAGSLWIGTNGGGLSQYDRSLDAFRNFRHNPEDPTSLSLNEVTALTDLTIQNTPELLIGTRKGVDTWVGWGPLGHLDLPSLEVTALAHATAADQSELLWIGTTTGLYAFDLTHRVALPDRNITEGLSSPQIQSLFFDQRDTQHRLWIGTSAGLDCLNLTTNQLSQQNLRGPLGPFPALSIRSLFPAQNGLLWLGTSQGAFRLSPETAELEPYSLDGVPEILSIYEDQAGVLWTGTMGDSLYRYNLEKDRFAHYQHIDGNPNSLGNNLVFSMLEDHNQKIWFCTGAGGIDAWDPSTRTFEHLSKDRDRELPQFWAIAESPGQQLWLGSSDQGLFAYQPGKGFSQPWTHEPARPESLANNKIRSLLVDSLQRLWVGTANGLELMLGPNRFQHISHDPSNPESLGHGNVQYILEDKNLLWLATLGGGLNRYDPNSQQVTQFRHDPKQAHSLSSDQVLVLFIDRQHHPDQLWLGTLGGGLNRFNLQNHQVTRYTTAAGLPNNVVYAIQADATGLLWMSTNNGLARFDPTLETFTHYSAQDGLQGPEFAQTSSLFSQSGQMYFGGNNGITVLDPSSLSTEVPTPPVVLTQFSIFNQPVVTRRNDASSPLPAPIDQTQKIALNYTKNMFSFEFAALNAPTPNTVQYSYQMAGLSQDWIPTTAQNRFAVFTNLSPGVYQLQVKARSANGRWRALERPLTIEVQPPPWRTWWAFCCYALLIAILIYTFIRAHKRELAVERAEKERQNAINERLRQVDKFKDEILANTSHELRTPLHGIIGLADSLRDGSTGEMSQRAVRNLDMIVSSGRRLTSLVNDILDFSKLKTLKLELQKTPVDLFTLTEMVLTLSKPLLANKNLELINTIPHTLPALSADENRLQQILHNLVGNAIKFTQSGFVKIAARLESENARLVIEIIDTGIGIPEEKLESIFNAFEQADTTTVRSYGGTGLGLAITKHLVALHGGTLSVNSVMGKGSIFSFTLPSSDLDGDLNGLDLSAAARVHTFSREDVSPTRDFTLTLDADPIPLESEWQDETGTIRHINKILIVDDEPINRQVLVNYLSPLGYQLIEAANGFSALEAVEEETFDLILLDIMMPRMSGYEVCSELRKKHRVSELPVIFLTARNQAQDLVEGFASGANDYLTKPITRSELLARVRAHLKLLHFHRSLDAKVSERTRELQIKNEELDARYFELETFSNIMRAIRGVADMEKVVNLLLDQATTLFPWTKAATALMRPSDQRVYRFLACKNYNISFLVDAIVTREELEFAFCRREHQISEGISLIQAPAPYPWCSSNHTFATPSTQVAITITQDGQIMGLVTLDAFDIEKIPEHDHEKLQRFREHLSNAVTRVQDIGDLVGTQSRLLEEANLAGKAEIATNVLHNVGNTLNSVQTSMHLIQERVLEQKGLDMLEKTVALIRQEGQIEQLLAHPEKRTFLRNTLSRTHAHLARQSYSLLEETRRLAQHLQKIVSLLMEQERHTHAHSDLSQARLSLNALLEETLRMEAYLLKHKRLEIVTQYGEVPPILAEKSKLVRIFFNILKNAWQAIEEAHPREGRIYLRTWTDQSSVLLEISDNGIGLIPENLSHVFEQGFSTKRHCEGFGLHYAANAIRDMCGTITLESDGPFLGCRVILSFPMVACKIDQPDQQLELVH